MKDLQWFFFLETKIFSLKNAFENVVCEKLAILDPICTVSQVLRNNVEWIPVTTVESQKQKKSLPLLLRCVSLSHIYNFFADLHIPKYHLMFVLLQKCITALSL